MSEQTPASRATRATPATATPAAKSPRELEAEINAARQRLATTIDELAHRAKPKEIARRQAESAKVSFTKATRTESGDLRTERVAALAAAAVALIGLGVLRRRRG